MLGTYRLSPIHLVSIAREASGLRLRVTGQSYYPDLASDKPETFINTELYKDGVNRYDTDIAGVVLSLKQDNRLVLNWKGRCYPLSPIEKTSDTPLAELKSGRLQAGADALRRALESGMKLGNDLVEYPFRRRAASLMERGQARTALAYGQLASELAPLSWRTHSDISGIWRALDEPAAARRAQGKAEALNPLLKE